MGKKNRILEGKSVLFSLLILFSGVGHAEVGPGNLYEKDAKGRVPASLSKDYPKAQEGMFEAQGFGEDFPDTSMFPELRGFPELEKQRDPAAEKEEALKKEAEEKKEMSKSQKRKKLSNELQLQRRVEVFYEGRVRLKNGAALWATEDSGTTSPKLEISTQEEVDPRTGSLRFKVYSNYIPFIKNWELRIFKKDKLNAEEEIEVLKGDADSMLNIEYKFDPDRYIQGDSIYYQFKVFESENIFDVIQTKKISFVDRSENTGLNIDNKLTESDAISKIWGQSSIEKQNIAIRGSRVRVVGNNIPRDHEVFYRNQPIKIDRYGKFVLEEHFPVGEHKINIDLVDKTNDETFQVPFTVDVSGKYFFVVGLADMRVGENRLSEKIAGLAGDDEYDGNVFLDGRLAYFLKGKIKGKYLITSQLDTTEGDIEEIFKGLHRKNSEALFRRLDPDRYYPVYGDNSSTTEQAPTLGKMYVKIEMDQSYAMWGNANTDFTGTLFSQYNRTLYGGHVKYKARSQTKYGDQVTEVGGFISEPETLFGHNEFVGTGGRLYTLRHNDVVQGSEKFVVEIRDRDSGLMKQQISLKPYQDYEFDYLAGRVVLTQPLTTFVLQAADEIIDPNGIGNDTYYLVADYEYSDTGDSLDSLTYGGRVKQWFGDHIALGGTYVEEDRSTSEYTLKGIDGTVRLGKESFVKAESTKTKDAQTGSNFESSDGGLSFVTKPLNTGPVVEAEAWGVESQFFLNDFLESTTEGVISTWYRDYEAGFSTARRQTQNDLKEYGFDLEFDFNKKDIIKSKVIFSEEVGGVEKQTLITSYGRNFKNGSNLSLEYRVDELLNVGSGIDQEGELIGLKYSHNITSGVKAYVKGQSTLSERGGYESNDRYALGSKFRIGRKWEGTTEFSGGDRGDALLAGLGYNVEQGHKVYANLDKSVDSSTGPVTRGITLGQRKTFNNGVRLTTENQFQEVGDDAGINQLYGLDYNLNKVMSLTFSYQMGDLENQITGVTSRKNAASIGFVYSKEKDITASSQASLVKSRGATNFDQLLLTNSLKFKVGPAHTWFFEADYSLSEDPTNTTAALARYIEGNVGYAFRPVMNDRLNLFGRYTFLYDLDSQAQENARNDQKVHIASIEGSYDLSRRWELGARVAQKIGSERVNRDAGIWVDTTLTFEQLRLRYHLIKKWDGIFEYRMVQVKEAEDSQQGFLIGLDYHLGSNFKVGAGFNFTRFNDDLINFSFNNYGWFINVVGKL